MSMLSSSLPSSPSSTSSSSTPFHFNKSNSFPKNLLPTSIKFRRSISATYATASPETSSSSLYEVLGIPIGASGDEIKAAYRRRAMSCHPDVMPSSVRGERNSASDEFIKVHKAYSTLSDPEKRAEYDKMMTIYRPSISTTTSFRGLSSSPRAPSFCSSPRRNWETDQCW